MCSKGFKAISWILVLLPFITGIFTYFFVKDVMREGASGFNAVVTNQIGGNAGVCGPACKGNKVKNICLQGCRSNDICRQKC
jgi:hypothetical protein